MSVALSPIINPHRSVVRRRHTTNLKCRTVSVTQRRRQSVAAVQSTTIIPPTPAKKNFAIRKSAYNGKRTRNKPYYYYHGKKSVKSSSPNKKRRIIQNSPMPTKSLRKSLNKNKPKNSQKGHWFQNLGMIGVGSFSQVFKVQSAASKKIFALKKSSTLLNTKEAVTDALNEVEIMQLLQTTNQLQNISNNIECKDEDSEELRENIWIVKFYDFWLSYDRHLYQIYDLYKYGTLFDIVEHNERFNYLQILQTIEQICNGLTLIHSLNIIHIDLKPTNIFITKDYTLKIGDFGISINLNKYKNKMKNSSKSKRALLSGDPIYIAPELMTFNRTLSSDINRKTDIFSLGIILLELLCDIKAPSQGQIFQNLRKNIIDFNIMEPSPIKKYKKHSKIQKTIHSHFDFTFTPQISKKNIDFGNYDESEFKIIEDIDNEIKDLCRQMLQKNSNLRPDSQQILNKIHEILNNESYKLHFESRKPLSELALPPQTIVHSINTNNHDGSNETGASHCNSHCNSDKKAQQSFLCRKDKPKIGWFIQESPKTATPLFHFDLCPHSPHSNTSSNHSNNNSSEKCDEFQLNLNSAFDNVENGQQNSPFLYEVHSSQKSKAKTNNQVLMSIDEDENDQLRPQNLFLSFMQ